RAEQRQLLRTFRSAASRNSGGPVRLAREESWGETPRRQARRLPHLLLRAVELVACGSDRLAERTAGGAGWGPGGGRGQAGGPLEGSPTGPLDRHLSARYGNRVDS